MSGFFDLTGKVAIVTGGNGGIGLGIAEGLAQAGAKLAIVGRNAEKSKTAAKVLAEQTGSEPLVLTADVAKPNEVNAAVKTVKEHFGRIDILFNNAGINIRKPPHTLSLEHWHTVPGFILTVPFFISH